MASFLAAGIAQAQTACVESIALTEAAVMKGDGIHFSNGTAVLFNDERIVTYERCQEYNRELRTSIDPAYSGRQTCPAVPVIQVLNSSGGHVYNVLISNSSGMTMEFEITNPSNGQEYIYTGTKRGTQKCLRKLQSSPALPQG